MRRNWIFFAIIGLLSVAGCGRSTSPDISWYEGADEYEEEDEFTPESNTYSACYLIPYKEMYGGLVTIPVTINGMHLDMIFDTGASITTITAAEANYLYQKGALSEDDIEGLIPLQTADGGISVGAQINLRQVVIGDQITLHDVEAVVVENQQAPLLLGQSVMQQFAETAIDHQSSTVKFYLK